MLDSRLVPDNPEVDEWDFSPGIISGIAPMLYHWGRRFTFSIFVPTQASNFLPVRKYRIENT